MKSAWIENDKIRDICINAPHETFHPDIAAHYSTAVPDNAENGDTFINGVLTKRAVPAATPEQAPKPVYKVVSPVEFKLLFTAPERIAIKTSNDPIIQDFFEIINDPRLTEVDLGLTSTQDALAYLESLSLIASGRKDVILLGVIR